jgi:hypothetical protein
MNLIVVRQETNRRIYDSNNWVSNIFVDWIFVGISIKDGVKDTRTESLFTVNVIDCSGLAIDFVDNSL